MNFDPLPYCFHYHTSVECVQVASGLAASGLQRFLRREQSVSGLERLPASSAKLLPSHHMYSLISFIIFRF